MFLSFKLLTDYKRMPYCNILESIQKINPEWTIEQSKFIAGKINSLASFWYEELEMKMNINIREIEGLR